MTHDQIVYEIANRAHQRGILTHYCGRALHCRGDRGLPDLVIVGPHSAAWVEVKTPRDELEPAQTTWKHMLRAAGQVHEVIRESDLAPGHAVDMLIQFVATGQAA